MDQTPLVDPPAAGAPPPLPPTTSLPARLLNVFATPGEVFEEVVTTPRAVKNWLVPTLIACVVAVISVITVLSQPVIQQKIREQMQAAMDKNVKAGKMTQGDADKTVEMFASPLFLKISGVISKVFWCIAGLFLWAFGMWLLGIMVFKTSINFMKAVEVVALAGMISVLGEIVTILLQVNFGNPSSNSSPALLIGEFDPQNPLHMVLAMLDLFVIWHLIVLAVGISRLARLPLSRVLFVITFVWLIFRILLIAGSMLMVKMFT